MNYLLTTTESAFVASVSGSTAILGVSSGRIFSWTTFSDFVAQEVMAVTIMKIIEIDFNVVFIVFD